MRDQLRIARRGAHLQARIDRRHQAVISGGVLGHPLARLLQVGVVLIDVALQPLQIGAQRRHLLADIGPGAGTGRYRRRGIISSADRRRQRRLRQRRLRFCSAAEGAIGTAVSELAGLPDGSSPVRAGIRFWSTNEQPAKTVAAARIKRCRRSFGIGMATVVSPLSRHERRRVALPTAIGASPPGTLSFWLRIVRNALWSDKPLSR